MPQTTLFADATPQTVVRVMVPLALPKLLDYTWPTPTEQPELNAPHVGQFVAVQVGKKEIHGVVVAVNPSPTSSPEDADAKAFKLKPASPLPPESAPHLAPQTVRFLQFAAGYYLAAAGEALRGLMPRAQVPPLPKRAGGANTASGQHAFKPVTLNPHQAAAAQAVLQASGAPVFLLDGLTGSGKTEVYFQVIGEKMAQATAHEKGVQSLILVPEISLTPQFLQRFEERFGVKPLVWHSTLTPVQRARAWHAVANGETCVVLGARSAVFLPFQNLHFVVIDEEHETAYKQEDGFRYHGRDMALALAHFWQCSALLASATPSLETMQKAQAGNIAHLLLPQRHGGAALPTITLIDLLKDKPEKGKLLSPPLLKAVAETLERKEQALLFLNRRGNAPMLICGACGDRRGCPSCSTTLTVHGNRLRCHHCGFAEPWPDVCESCDHEGEYTAFGPGTRRVMQEAQEAFPEANIAVADTDAITSPKQMEALVNQLQQGTVDILVGTQMVAKGHHFPNLTCVGVLDGDMGLAHGELRAAERTFQLLTQVAGRAGRGEKKGTVYLQTHQPDHTLMAALKKHDRDAFYAHELEQREMFLAPPFGKQVALIVQGKNDAQTSQTADALAAAFQELPEGTVPEGVMLLGPIPAPMHKLRDHFRYRLLLQGPKGVRLQNLVQTWLSQTPVPTAVRVVVDVDPVGFY